MRVSDWPLYHYTGEVIEVDDGDSFKGLLDLGDDVHKRRRIRIVGMDTPELKGKGVSKLEKYYAELAKQRLEWVYLAPGTQFYLHTYKDAENLDRLLGDVMIPALNDPAEYMSIRQAMDAKIYTARDLMDPFLFNVVDAMIREFEKGVPLAVKSTAKGPKWREVVRKEMGLEV